MKTRSQLAPFVELARGYTNPVNFHSDVIAMGYNTAGTDETWCIDTRGILTLSVEKDTFQQLGLVGKQLPWKQCQGQYIIILAQKLPEDAKSWNTLGPKQKAALELYDKIRLKSGLDAWEVVYHCTKHDKIQSEHEFSKVQPEIASIADVHIPVPNLEPPSREDDDRTEDWKENMSELFEWVGMAGLGSQRLHLNDRVDPYIAVYTPPEPFKSGSITTIRWRGLLHPAFVQTVINTCQRQIESAFVAVTMHSITRSPVVHLSRISTSSPLRLPRADAEDTLSIVFTPGDRSGDAPMDGGSCKWCSVECISQWDMRWG